MREEAGATAIEYVLIAGAMALAVMGAWPLITAGMATDFATVDAGFNTIGFK